MQPGQIFGTRYRVERLLGEGGMARVFAVHTRNGERLAVKILRPELAKKTDIVTRFLREARSASAIRNAHVAKIHDVAVTEDGIPYLVMEYLEGVDLAEILTQRGRIPYEQAVDWVLEAAEGIAEAHAQKIVHRDIKPSNLFCARQPEGDVVKVLDFGICKSMDDPGSLSLTRTTALLGSPLYMSPEQLRAARDIDERGDIWSLGVVLHELIAGQPPFNAPTLPELSFTVLSSQGPPPLVDAPPGLGRIVATCLTQDRTKRFASLADFADAAAAFGTDRARASAARIIARLGMPARRVTHVTQETSDDVKPMQADLDAPASNPSLSAMVHSTSLPLRRHAGITAGFAALAVVGLFAIFVSVRRTGKPAVAVASASAIVRLAETAPPPAEVASATARAPTEVTSAPVAIASVAASAEPVSTTHPRPRASAAPKKPPKNLFDSEN